MPDVEIIRELPMSLTGANQVLVRKGDQYFVVSSVVALYSGFETLVFPADEDGRIRNYLDVAGGRGMSREEAIESLAESNIEARGDPDAQE